MRPAPGGAMSLVLCLDRPADAARLTFLERATRLVPCEAITVYLAATTGVPPSGPWPLLLLGTGVGLTLGALAVHARRLGLRVPAIQHLLRAIVFTAWAFALGNPLAPAPPVLRWVPVVAAVVVPVFGSFAFPGARDPAAPPRRRPA